MVPGFRRSAHSSRSQPTCFETSMVRRYTVSQIQDNWYFIMGVIWTCCFKFLLPFFNEVLYVLTAMPSPMRYYTMSTLWNLKMKNATDFNTYLRYTFNRFLPHSRTVACFSRWHFITDYMKKCAIYNHTFVFILLNFAFAFSFKHAFSFKPEFCKFSVRAFIISIQCFAKTIKC